ncbi:MAG: hypothetical protein WBA57_11090 [Elainellaceae cyanobacterium]
MNLACRSIRYPFSPVGDKTIASKTIGIYHSSFFPAQSDQPEPGHLSHQTEALRPRMS